MKKIICLIAVLFSITSLTQAQGSLQFNQIKLVGTEEAVPTGKVWKINGILPSGRMTAVNQNGTTSINHIMVVNSTNVYYATGDATGSLYGNGQTGFTSESANISASTIWLPEGTTLAASTGIYRISVTEFNVVP